MNTTKIVNRASRAFKTSSWLRIAVLAAFVFIAGCKKKESQPDAGSTKSPTGTLLVHLHTNLDMEEVYGYNITYTTSTGRQISLSKAQLYISNIELVKTDGSVYSVPNTTLLQVFGTETYTIGGVPTGNYKSVRFNVGLDPATNLKNPSTSSSDVLNTPSMWFGTTAQPQGYIFVNLQGKIDTTADASGTVASMQPFNLLIGTDANYKKVVMPDKNFSVTPGTQLLHINTDYSKLFNGIKLSDSNNLMISSPSDNATSNGGAVAKNISSMFSYE